MPLASVDGMRSRRADSRNRGGIEYGSDEGELRSSRLLLMASFLKVASPVYAPKLDQEPNSHTAGM